MSNSLKATENEVSEGLFVHVENTTEISNTLFSDGEEVETDNNHSYVGKEVKHEEVSVRKKMRRAKQEEMQMKRLY